MVTLAVLARTVLAAALTAGVNADPSPSNAPDLPSTPDETMASSPGQHMEVCESGGMGSGSCDVNCHVVFNFYTKQCNVSCRSGYYACCSCDQGCHCVVDHDDMWPLPPSRDPAR
jgi:hypothetical protein